MSIQLSENTSANVDAQKTEAPCIITRKKSNGTESRLFLRKEEWQSLVEKLPSITEAVNTVGADSIVIPLTIKGRVVEISTYEGWTYCGIFYENKDGSIKRFGGMNFNVKEWSELANYLQQQSGDAERPTKRPRLDDDLRPVTYYGWTWLSEKDQSTPSSRLYSSGEACLRDARDNKPRAENSYLKIRTETMNITHDEQLLEAMWLYLAERKVEEMKANECEGCEFDCPGQRDHMSGCLMLWDEAVETHAAKAEITDIDILKLYSSVLKFMGQSAMCSGSELETIANFKTPKDIQTKLKQIPVASLYRDLFSASTTTI